MQTLRSSINTFNARPVTSVRALGAAFGFRRPTGRYIRRNAAADPSVVVSQPPEQQAQQHAAAAPGATGQAKDDVSGAMLEPSVVNTSWVRALAATAAVLATAASSAILPARMAAFIHVTAFGIWLGSNIWNTFFVGLTMFKHMPRQMFGRVQSQLFPKYFGLTTACNVVVLGSLLLTASPANAAATTRAAIVLGSALACSLANMLFIEPLATRIMFQRYDLENKEPKTEDDKAQIKTLYSQFGKWHGISSLLNLLITCATVSHGYFLAGALAF